MKDFLNETEFDTDRLWFYKGLRWISAFLFHSCLFLFLHVIVNWRTFFVELQYFIHNTLNISFILWCFTRQTDWFFNVSDEEDVQVYTIWMWVNYCFWLKVAAHKLNNTDISSVYTSTDSFLLYWGFYNIHLQFKVMIKC